MEDTFYNSLKQKYTDYHSVKYEKAKEISDSCPINTDNGWTGEEMFIHLQKKFEYHVKTTGQNELTVQLFGLVNGYDRFSPYSFKGVYEWQDFCDWYENSVENIKDETFLKDKIYKQCCKSLDLIEKSWNRRHPLIKMTARYPEIRPSNGDIFNRNFYPSLTLSFTP